jgi:YbgC/YbaW family acyl-CoA thioester hydrolase
MSETFIFRKRVEFSETDAAGIVHFSNYFRYMEMAEHAFFRALGFSIHPKDKSYGFPRVHAGCDFSGALKFEDEIIITLAIVEMKRKSLVFDFTIDRVRQPDDTADNAPETVAKGRFVTVCVRLDVDNGRMISQPIPPEISQKLTPFVITP